MLEISLSLAAQQIVPGTWSYRTGPNGEPNPPEQGPSHFENMTYFDSSPYKEFSFHSGSGNPTAETFLLNFRLLEPVDYDPSSDKEYPIIIMFHGLGEAGIRGTNGYPPYEKTDWQYWNNDHNIYNGGKQHLAARNNPEPDAHRAFNGFVMAPQANYYWDDKDRHSAIELIDLLLTKYKIDPNRIYLHGYSNGGDAVWKIAEERPDLVTAMIVISWVYSGVDPSRILHIPVWQFQGELDNIITAESAKYIQNKLKDAGATPLYTEYANAGHGIWDKAYAEDDFFYFLKSKNKTDIHPYFGKTTVCLGDEVNIRLGISPGFKAYQWKFISDGKETVLPAGTDNNELVATQTGDYFVRFSRVANPASGDWTDWSKPLTISVQQSDASPAIQALSSTALPALDGKTTVALRVPSGSADYQWYKNDNLLTGPQYASNQITVGQQGSYTVSVTESNECPALKSPPVVVTVNAPDTEVAAPAALKASAISENEIDLSWTDKASNEKTYEIYRSKGSNSAYTFLDRVPANTTTFSDMTLQANNRYYYVIRAINDQGPSKRSNEASAITPSDKVPPTIPGFLSHEMITPQKTRLIWGSSTDNQGEVSYDIYVNGTKRFSTSDTTFVWSGLSKDGIYTVYVVARDGAGNVSSPGNQLTVKAVFEGLFYRYYYGGLWDKVADYASWGVESTGYVDNFTIDRISDGGIRPDVQGNYFAFDFEGYLFIKNAGNYEFRLRAAAGSILSIDGNNVANNDGNHADKTVNGSLFLSKGAHFIKVRYYDRVQDEILTVSYKGADTNGEMIEIPDEALTSSNKIFADPPVSPDSLRATSIDQHQVRLQWIDRSGDESGFEILRGKAADGPFKKIITTGTNSETWSDRDLKSHTTYFYRVRAVNANGESDPVAALVTTHMELDRFDARCYGGRVSLSWKTLTPSMEDMIIERSLNDSSFVVIGRYSYDSTGIDSIAWRDNVSPAGIKTYRLRQKNDQGYYGVSETHSVECEMNDQKFSVELYPVPVNNGVLYVAVHSGVTADPVVVRIIDNTGRVYLNKTVEGSQLLSPLQIDVTGFPDHSFFILQVMQGQYQAARRFIIY